MIAVIGSGYIGSFIADYLAGNDDTTVVDQSEESLRRCRVANTVKGNVKSAQDIIRKADLVIFALPGDSAIESMQYVADMGKDIVDISFVLEDADTVGEISEKKGSFYVPHCGFAPGLTNILAGNLISEGYDDEIEIFCGGLPVRQENPLGYKVTWSAEGLIDEYTRKARFIRNGIPMEADPLESTEEVSIDGYGKFEAFYSDGLATLLKNGRVRSISEKTLRYPGHLEKIKFMRDIGMFSDAVAGGVRIRDYTAKVLEGLPGSNEDQCFLLVRGSDSEGDTKTYTGYDRYDAEEQRTAMCRMTGLTCASVALSLLDDPDTRTGTIGPELLGMDSERMSAIMSRLTSSGIVLQEGK